MSLANARQRAALRVRLRLGFAAALLAACGAAAAQTAQAVVNISTRPGVTQRLLVLAPPAPRAVAILMAGGHGGLRIFPNGSIGWGDNNFLVRSRQLFVDQGLMAVVVDAPSDRQSPPYLAGFRQTPEHASDLRAVIAWAREQAKVPVWLVGTSRGTQSAAYAATVLQGADGPDGVVLSASILVDESGRPVPAMPLESLRIPVLVVHHEEDGCRACPYGEVPRLMAKLGQAPRHRLLAFRGGNDRGDACGAMAHHGFNGQEQEVVAQTVAWMLEK